MSEDGGVISIGDAKFNIDDTVNGFVNVASGGSIGYENGSFTKGAVTRAGDEVLGEITGKNQARAANNIARDQLEEAKAAKKKEMQDEQLRAQQQDVQASSGAASIRATATAQRNNLLGGDASRDFLGL